MPLSRLSMLLVSAVCAVSSLAAQVPRRQPQEITQDAPRLLVANPYSFTLRGLRHRRPGRRRACGLEWRKIVGAEYQVISRADDESMR